MTTAMVGVVLGFGAGGVVAGTLARWLLAALARGARVRAPLCEVGVGAAWAVSGGLWAVGRLPPPWLPAVLGLGWLGVAAGIVDLRHRRLPDALTVPAASLTPLVLLPVGAGAVGRGLAGSIVAAVGYGVVHLVRPTALGAGDVKLATALGAVLGGVSWGAVAAGAALTAALSGLIALVQVGTGRLSWGAAVPHGPPMLAATWLVTVVAVGGWAG